MAGSGPAAILGFMLPLIRVAVIDDHHAIRLGLQTALESEPGLEPVGSAATASEAEVLLYRTRPDVVLVDYHLPGTDGLTLSRRIKSQPPTPGLVIYSAFADPAMTVPAIVAGDHAIVHKGGQTRDLFDAIRRAARGETMLPDVSEPQLEAAGHPREAAELPLLGVLQQRTTPPHGAPPLTHDRSEYERRVDGILRRLTVPVVVASPSAWRGR